MYTRSDFLRCVRHETEIAKHLFGKLPAGTTGHALGDNMRDTTELLRYLAYCGYVPVRCNIDGDWTQIPALVEAGGHKDMAPEAFPRFMDEQLARIEEMVAPLTDEDFATRETALPWGTRCSLGAAMVDTTVRFLTAYRMQLFLHAKSAGAAELNTMNCWLGADEMPAAAD